MRPPISIKTALVAAPTTALCAAWAEAWYRRPHASWDEEGSASFAAWLDGSYGESSGLLTLARASATCALKWLFFVPYLSGVHAVELIGIEKMHGAVRDHVHDGGRGLLSVSNHASTLDDPGLMCAGVLPSEAFYTPRKMRWNFCAEKVCFSKSEVLATIFGAGKALPLSRTGGLSQPVFKTTARMLASGHHVHIYPEGRVWQEGHHARDAEGRWATANSKRFGRPLVKLGPLHRGVGDLYASAVEEKLKLLRQVQRAEAEAAEAAAAAAARVGGGGANVVDTTREHAHTSPALSKPMPLDLEALPMLLPFFALGMDNVLPLESNGRPAKGLKALRRRGPSEPPVVVKVGDEIVVRDLVRAYELETTQETRLALVDGVVERIESALVVLEGEVRALARERGVEEKYGIPCASTREEWEAAQAKYAALFTKKRTPPEK
tara:strand:- start:229 stop:1539 length:1311 start_codon:yes stop_codon:yes gene_type:complete